jgi:hypothetical protein
LFLSLRRLPSLLICFFTILLPPQLLSVNTPDAARGVHSLPFFYFFIILGLDFFYIKINQSFFRKIKNFLFLFIFLCIFFIDLKAYFTWITKETTLKARQPAIKIDQFDRWWNNQEFLVKKGFWGFSVNEFLNFVK